MRLKIRDKLFLALLLSNGAVLLAMVLLMQWSFGRGFLNYVGQVEDQTRERLVAELEAAYAREGGWDFLRGNFPRWHALFGLGPEDAAAPPAGRPPAPPQSPLGIVTRITLLDAQGEYVVGNRRLAKHPEILEGIADYPVRHGAAVVGRLRMAPLTALDDRLDRRFVENQTRTFHLIALVLLGLAAGLSLWLARQLVAPVRLLAAATRELAAGRFEQRLPVTRRDELGRLAADFNSLAETLAHNEQARRRWIADISHELRTPLTILRGELQAVEDGVRPFDRETQQSLATEVERLGSLVEDLYQLALSDSGALTYRKEELDLPEVLDDALDAFRQRLGAKGLALEIADWPDSPVWVFADGRRLYQLFSNILENTLRYTDPGGRLRLSCRPDRQEVEVRFEDSAPGVPAASAERLFERFYRVDSSRSRARGGAGLGLAICKNIVEAHGGTVGARPSELGGLAIHIRLPLGR